MAKSKGGFNKWCEGLLAQYKRRNFKRAARHVNGIRIILERDGDHIVQPKFGGSVAKGTYVTGISDVDVLLFVEQTTLKTKPPSEVIEYMRTAIKKRYRKHRVEAGSLAVTVHYADKMELQVLPAIRKDAGYRLADPDGRGWSNVILPDGFLDKLSEVNRTTDGRLVATIKLAKALLRCGTEDSKVTGYHIESLAVGAFEHYRGEPDPRSMLVHFLRRSSRAVLTPMPDLTGQSKRVDGKLGPQDSGARRQASSLFGQLRVKVRDCETKDDFNALFCVGG